MSVEETGAQERRLLEVFDEGYDIFEALSQSEEATNSICIQNKVKQSMRLLEDATRLTSLAGIFSANELVDEVATENLRLFLLPAILGTLTLKLTGSVSRTDVVISADTYFRDFIERCNNYELCSVTLPPPLELECKEVVSDNAPCRPFDLGSAARSRAQKIARYKDEKALEQEVVRLSQVVKEPNVDEEVKRDYFIKLIKSYINKAEEELDALQSEARILAHMKAAQKNESLSATEENKRRRNLPAPKPLKAVIITKDEVQKAVFGAGYPSLPTMTVEEFYDKRVKDGIFPDPEKAGRSLQDMARQGTVNVDLDEKEAAEKERKIEIDDDEELRRQRAMDEYRDEHKRGEGNRYNRS